MQSVAPLSGCPSFGSNDFSGALPWLFFIGHVLRGLDKAVPGRPFDLNKDKDMQPKERRRNGQKND